MNLFELFVKIGVDDQASDKLSGLSSKLGNGLKTAAKIGTAAVGAAAAGITALTKAAVDNYAEYEQLIGGVETLYGAKYKTIEEYIEGTGAAAEYAEQTFAEYQKRQQAVLDNAANAYKTAGMSANEYMNTVNGFAASLTSSLGEYEWQAASYADMIVSDMADNANKMGTNMEMIQNAYAGFAKQNYTMLDNLKLGYGGTKTEMERLLRDAERMAGYIEGSLDIESFADIADAIHIVQEEMGITGTTAFEAGRTISGSVGAMKSAWSNLITGLADGNADIGKLVDNLVTTIVGDGTESNLGVLGNVMPAVKTALSGASRLVSELLPKIVQEIPSIINDNLPVLAEAAISIIQSLVDGISENQEMLMETAMEIIVYLATSLISMLPQIVELGLDLMVSLAEGIVENVDELLPAVLEAIMAIGTALIEHAPELINAGVELASAIMNGVLEQFQGLEPIIMGVVTAFGAYKAITLASEIASKAMAAGQWLVNAAMNANPIMLIVTLIAGLVAAVITLWNTNDGFRNALIGAWESIKSAATKIFTSVANFFTQTIPNAFNSVLSWFNNIGSKFANIGRNIIAGIRSGISSAWNNLVSWFRGLFGDLIGIAKRILGIASPSKVFKKIGGFTAEGFGVGFEDEFAHVKDDMEDALNFDDASVGINASIRKVGAGVAGGALDGTSIGNITINIDGAKYSDEQSLASAIALEIQNMTDRRAAVYA